MEIESMKENGNSAEVDSKVGQSENKTSEILHE